MARIVRPSNLVAQRTIANTFTFGTSTGTLALDLGLQPPMLGARPHKWWLKNTTAGTGTQTLTCYLVVSGGTSSTRQVVSSIAVDTNATAPGYYEAYGNGNYEPAATDMGKGLDLIFTGDTTATNAIDGVTIGVIWGL